MDDFDALESAEDWERATTRNGQPRVAKTETYPCVSCAGTGKWQPSRRSYFGAGPASRPCFSCNGTGQKKLDARRQQVAKQAAAKAKVTKAENLFAKQTAFREANPGVYEFLRNATWSEFAQKLAAGIDEYGSLTERQLLAAASMMEKAAARKAERQAARTVAVDLSAIERMFDKARENGLSKLVYRAGGLVISPAKATGANPGAIYVKTKGGEYLGKVKDGKFAKAFACKPAHEEKLREVAADPAGEAVRYGRETGECCCCGRELSDPISVQNGIGPICQSKWGF